MRLKGMGKVTINILIILAALTGVTCAALICGIIEEAVEEITYYVRVHRSWRGK
jgi:sensor domain CHASE-containing protein